MSDATVPAPRIDERALVVGKAAGRGADEPKTSRPPVEGLLEPTGQDAVWVAGDRSDAVAAGRRQNDHVAIEIEPDRRHSGRVGTLCEVASRHPGRAIGIEWGVRFGKGIDAVARHPFVRDQGGFRQVMTGKAFDGVAPEAGDRRFRRCHSLHRTRGPAAGPRGPRPTVADHARRSEAGPDERCSVPSGLTSPIDLEAAYAGRRADDGAG